MRFKYETFEQRCERIEEWHEWFAWYPIWDKGTIYWLEKVMCVAAAVNVPYHGTTHFWYYKGINNG